MILYARVAMLHDKRLPSMLMRLHLERTISIAMLDLSTSAHCLDHPYTLSSFAYAV